MQPGRSYSNDLSSRILKADAGPDQKWWAAKLAEPAFDFSIVIVRYSEKFSFSGLLTLFSRKSFRSCWLNPWPLIRKFLSLWRTIFSLIDLDRGSSSLPFLSENLSLFRIHISFKCLSLLQIYFPWFLQPSDMSQLCNLIFDLTVSDALDFPTSVWSSVILLTWDDPFRS